MLDEIVNYLKYFRFSSISVFRGIFRDSYNLISLLRQTSISVTTRQKRTNIR